MYRARSTAITSTARSAGLSLNGNGFPVYLRASRSIRLIVSFEVHTSGLNTTGDGYLPDGALGGSAVVFKLARSADVD